VSLVKLSDKTARWVHWSSSAASIACSHHDHVAATKRRQVICSHGVLTLRRANQSISQSIALVVQPTATRAKGRITKQKY